MLNLNKNIRKIIELSGIKNSNLFISHNLRSTFVTNIALINIDESIISYITHPKKKTLSSVSIYDRREMRDKSQTVVEAVIKANKIKQSSLYTYNKVLYSYTLDIRIWIKILFINNPHYNITVNKLPLHNQQSSREL